MSVTSLSLQPSRPAAAASVTDSDALRRAALARSWQRDRRVGRRRLAWRWCLWLLGRYALPVAAVVVAVASATWWLHARDATPDIVTRPIPPPASEPPPPIRLRLDLSPVPAQAPPAPTVPVPQKP